MNQLIKEITEPFLNEIAPRQIKKVIGIYGGRFQPFGPHHLKTYKWLAKQVDVAYITTSNIKKPPRHPMNFKEKVRHMSKMGVKANQIVQEKTPYVADNVLKKFDPKTTAVVYIFGQKDAGRLKGGKTKSGKLAYYQDFKKFKGNLKPYEEHGYFLTAPHVSISVGGKEVSGTSMRELLGSDKYDDKERAKLFKKMFGYLDKGIFQMMVNKFKKLFEHQSEPKRSLKKKHKDGKGKDLIKGQKIKENVKLPIKVGDTVKMGKFKNKKVVVKDISWNEKGDLLINGRPALKFRIMKEFYEKIPLIIDEANNVGIGADDGPNHGFGNFRSYRKRGNTAAKKLGYKVVDFILNSDVKSDKNYRIYPEGPVGAVSFLPAGIGTGNTPNNQVNLTGSSGYNKWKKHIDKLATLVGFELIDFLEKEEEDIVKKDSVQTIKKQKEDEKEIVVSEPMGESFSKDWWKENLLTEGGAYGHMAHPFDDKNLTFGDLKKIIELGLGGQLSREDNVTEKLDGQNIMISWKNGKLLAARNKGHIKNAGKTALDAKGVASKFKGRGDIRNAFVFAMRDLEKAIKGLSQKQKDKIFNEGQHWMNMEVMWPKSANVVDYDKAELVFHGALVYDDKGNVKGEVKGSGRILAGMIKQINQHIQKKYKIGKPVFLDVPKHQDFGKMKGKFLSKLSKYQARYGLKDNDTLALYHQLWWEVFISNNWPKKLSGKVVEGLVKRWAFFDKSYSIPMIKADMKRTDFFDEKALQEILDFDKKNHAAQVKKNMKPFEELFFEVGAEILKNVKGFMAANPDKSVQNMKKKLDAAIKDVQSGGDIKKLNKLKVQLDRLNSIGGTSAIVPSEGIVFKYKGKTYKFTGAFAPVNQIAGLMTF
jgi:hypothetical protein